MMWNLEDIRKMRRQLGITQNALAKLSGVSQSMIAKTESGKLDPGFSSIKKIFLALEGFKADKIVLAKDVMNKNIEAVDESARKEDIIKIMLKKGYSQLLVEKNGRITGLITEKSIIDALAEGKRIIFEEAPPAVSPETPLKLVIDLLHYFQIVVVQSAGNRMGVITKIDVLGKTV
jgi:predicted transcriptional regulator